MSLITRLILIAFLAVRLRGKLRCLGPPIRAGLELSTHHQIASEKEDNLKRIAAVLTHLQLEEGIKTTLSTGSNERRSIYSVVEKHVKPKSLSGAGRWWRVS